jgi:hypothetical protein
VLPKASDSTSTGWFSCSFYCTVKAIVICLLIGLDPEVVAVTVTLAVPVGVPELRPLLHPPGLCMEHAAPPIAKSDSTATNPRKRTLFVSRFRLRDTMPMTPGKKSA